MPETTRLTYDDVRRMFPEPDNVRRELIDGELIVSPSPLPRHQRLLSRLHGEFYIVLRHRPELGEVFMAPLDVLFSSYDVVEPDVLFIEPEQDVLTEKNVQGAPSLVVEVLSQNTRLDRVRKRDLYARFGVPEYWIVDPEADRVEIHVLASGTYARPHVLGPGDTLTYTRLPELSIDLRWFFS